MKPSFMHYVFAYDLPFRGFLACWAILGVAMVFSVCEPSLAMFSDWTFCVFFVFSLVLAPVLFALFSVLFVWPFLLPVYWFGDRLAGAPFRVGDHVRILIGPHRGRVVEVYDVWDSRHQIRVRLDAEAESAVRDVFSFNQVLRENAA